MVIPCNLEEITAFGGTYCFHLQDRRVSYTRKLLYRYTEMKGTRAGGGEGGRHLKGKDMKKKFLKRKNDERKCKGEVDCYMSSGSVLSRFVTASCERKLSIGLHCVTSQKTVIFICKLCLPFVQFIPGLGNDTKCN
jgi:hypothetical protein